MCVHIDPYIWSEIRKPFHVNYVILGLQIAKSSELYQLLKVSSSGSNGILDPSTYMPRSRPMSVIKPKMPILVVEGLDGSGI